MEHIIGFQRFGVWVALLPTPEQNHKAILYNFIIYSHLTKHLSLLPQDNVWGQSFQAFMEMFFHTYYTQPSKFPIGQKDCLVKLPSIFRC